MADLLTGYLAHITAAIAGGATHHAFSKWKEWRQRRKEENHFPIEGRYISTFEDEESGKRVERTAIIQLKQYGLKISGETTAGDKSWFLNGYIDGSYIFGQYRAVDKYDEGKGVFFLQVKRGGIMEGLWSGYDSENRKITSGHYRFVQAWDSIVIERLNVEQYARAIKVAEKELGDSYIREADFREGHAVAYGASYNQDICGFCVGRTISMDDFATRHARVYGAKTRAFEGMSKIGLLSSVAVSSKFKGRGIGTRLAEACAQDLVKDGAKILVVTAWRSKDGTHVEGMALAYGFEEVAVIEKYWHDDSLANKFKCPVCGDPPCLCSAVVYVKYT